MIISDRLGRVTELTIRLHNGERQHQLCPLAEPTHCFGGKPRPGRKAELLEHVLQMSRNRPPGDEQPLRDLAVRKALCSESHDPELSFGEALPSEPRPPMPATAHARGRGSIRHPFARPFPLGMRGCPRHQQPESRLRPLRCGVLVLENLLTSSRGTNCDFRVLRPSTENLATSAD